ncbi:hypothetical protein [Helicobacter sp.]|uniref:hypothetical protein n=1 Tax=Helicobacter sp. TaxID=218 RepID=UPI0025C0217F|nr:hypothetical protein [Helicobacter sp.]MBR2495598.1 hypothetical protein [Helicobacter sp.]
MLHILKRKLMTLRHLLSQLHRLPYLQTALSDPSGLGGLQLRLFNAHIPQAHYGIFYNMLLHTDKNSLRGGAESS